MVKRRIKLQLCYVSYVACCVLWLLAYTCGNHLEPWGKTVGRLLPLGFIATNLSAAVIYIARVRRSTSFFVQFVLLTLFCMGMAAFTWMRDPFIEGFVKFVRKEVVPVEARAWAQTVLTNNPVSPAQGAIKALNPPFAKSWSGRKMPEVQMQPAKDAPGKVELVWGNKLLGRWALRINPTEDIGPGLRAAEGLYVIPR